MISTLEKVLGQANAGGALRSTMGTAVAADPFVRTANTTAYAAGQVINAAGAAVHRKLLNAARVEAGSGLILSASVRQSTNAATKASLELWVFDAQPSAAWADAAVFAPNDADLDAVVAVFTFANVYSAGAARTLQLSDPSSRGFKLAAGRDLWYALVVRNAYVPASGERFVVRAVFAQD